MNPSPAQVDPHDPALQAELDAALADRREGSEALLAELVRYPSVLGHEHGVQTRMEDALAQVGFVVDAFASDWRELPGAAPVDWDPSDRPTVIGVMRGDPDGRSLTVNGHVDVVPPGPEEAWSSPPFRPQVKDGWMVGRGAGDMKAGIVAALVAVQALGDLGMAPAGTLAFHSVVEEECSGNGALAAALHAPDTDAAIIPEPFDRTVLLQQVGVVWARIRVRGRSTHVLEAKAGTDAIGLALEVIQALRAFEAEWNDPERLPPGYAEQPNPLHLNVGRIDGGDWASSVPSLCTLRVRVGIAPGTDVATTQRRVQDHLARFAAAHPLLRSAPPELAWFGFHAEPYALAPEAPIVRAVSEVHRDLTGAEPTPLFTTATTDARILAARGIPTTCYGPTARAIHGADEAVQLDSVFETSRALARLIGRWCGLRRAS